MSGLFPSQPHVTLLNWQHWTIASTTCSKLVSFQNNVPYPNPKKVSKTWNIPDTTELLLSLEQMEDNKELDNPHKPKNQAKH